MSLDKPTKVITTTSFRFAKTPLEEGGDVNCLSGRLAFLLRHLVPRVDTQ